MRRISFVCFVLMGALPAQKPFQPTAKLGEPAQVGAITRIMGSGERIDTGLLRELTLDSAELALTFPNRMENVVASGNEKLLILRGSMRNPERDTVAHLGPRAVIGLRLWEKYTGAGKFQFVAHFDPETLRHIDRDLKSGESARFVGVWRVPADFRDFRLGATGPSPHIVPWYDLNSAMGKLRSAFAEPDGIGVRKQASSPPGQSFELDGLELKAEGVSRPGRIAGAATDASKPLYVVTVAVRNALLLPARWGWQYFTVELIGADGSATKAYPDVIDPATDRSWGGDLPAGATVRGQYLFYPAGPVRPKALRMTSVSSGRTVEAGLP